MFKLSSIKVGMKYQDVRNEILTLAKFTTQSLQIRTRRVCWIVKLNIYKMPTCSCRMPS